MDRQRALLSSRGEAGGHAYSLANPDKFCPTHTCFDDVVEYIFSVCAVLDDGSRPDQLQLAVVDPTLEGSVKRLIRSRDTLYAVHGLCRMDGETFAHAWVEPGKKGQGDLVLEVFWLAGVKKVVAQRRTDYYRQMHVTDTVHYLPADLIEKHHATDYAGPWLPRIAAYTANAKRGEPPRPSLPGLP